MRLRRQQRAGFSLMELMIAIVILGIGMVMVATVFPIGLDMARQTIQMNISQVVVDSAIATLQLKMPGPDPDINTGIPGTFDAAVLVPDPLETEGAHVTGMYESPLELNAADITALSMQTDANGALIGFFRTSDDWLNLKNSAGDSLSAFSSADKSKFQIFTEESAWPVHKIGNIQVQSRVAIPLPYQNVAVNYGTNPLPDPLTVPPTFITPRARFPRVQLADQVFPPIPINFEPGAGWVIMDPENPDTEQAKGLTYAEMRDRVMKTAALHRRYSWVAFHRRMSPEAGMDDMLVTVAVLHRADLNGRFARQQDQSSSTPEPWLYNLTNASELDALKFPAADPDANSDTLFPQPWLVAFDEVILSEGMIRCSAAVARLLPRGSRFIVAYETNSGLPAGTAKEILDNTYDPQVTSNLSSTVTLRFARGGSDTINNQLVYVFPPVYDRDAGVGIFRGQSPLVGISMRRVGVQ